MNTCVMCGCKTREIYFMALERKTTVSKIRWEYPLCVNCFNDMRVSYAEKQYVNNDAEQNENSLHG